MNYNEFIEAIKENKIEINAWLPFDFEIGYHVVETIKKSRYNFENRKREKKHDTIIYYWKTGGVSGGSCWESSDPQEYYEGDRLKPKEFYDLIKILKIFAPKITFIEYKELESAIIHSGSDINYEYYGNRDDYSYEYVNLNELFDWLVAKNFITLST